MANDEHKELAQFLKQVHSSLRVESSKVGPSKAWQEHCEKTNILEKYAECMQKLATTHWTENCANEASPATSRIQWTVDLCQEYFIDKTYVKYKEKEHIIANKIGISLAIEESFLQPIKLIDVGSCYNPFTYYAFFDVFAIDLCPANNTVLKCDFLQVSVGSNTILSNNNCDVEQLQNSYFDVATFCFLLEYLPSSDLRITACEKAYSVLKPGGLLIINTPDSKHVGANSKIMKCWQYTLAVLGFTRIKYEKLKHMHCMAFRKALHKDIAVRWASIHKQPYMDYLMQIPQDYSVDKDHSIPTQNKISFSFEDFKELPFCDILE